MFQLLGLHFAIFTYTIDYGDLFINLSYNVPKVIFKVFGQVFPCIIGPTLDPKLVDHDHFVVNFHLLLGFEDNALNEIELFTNFEIKDIFYSGFLILNLNKQTDIRLLYFLEVSFDFFKLFVTQTFILQTLDCVYQRLHILGL